MDTLSEVQIDAWVKRLHTMAEKWLDAVDGVADWRWFVTEERHGGGGNRAYFNEHRSWAQDLHTLIDDLQQDKPEALKTLEAFIAFRIKRRLK